MFWMFDFRMRLKCGNKGLKIENCIIFEKSIISPKALSHVPLFFITSLALLRINRIKKILYKFQYVDGNVYDNKKK